MNLVGPVVVMAAIGGIAGHLLRRRLLPPTKYTSVLDVGAIVGGVVLGGVGGLVASLVLAGPPLSSSASVVPLAPTTAKSPLSLRIIVEGFPPRWKLE